MEFPAGRMLHAADFRQNAVVTCDAVVIGSGAGGAVVAHTLASAGMEVAILEEGRAFAPHELTPKASWAYRHLYAERNTRVARGNTYIPVPGGRAVGGSTVINSAICFRTPSSVLKEWRESFGVPWADEATLGPSFVHVEQTLGVTKTYEAIAGHNNLLFKKGAEGLGLGGDFISRNAPGCVGCGVCQLGCPVGGKGSVDRNFIPFSLAEGAALFTSVRAETLLVDGKVAKGVEAWVLDPLTEKPEHRLRVWAPKVFLCAGAIQSPLFLRRQKQIAFRGPVGEHLHVHTATGMCARFEQQVDAWKGATQGYYVKFPNFILETFSATPDIYYTQFEAFARPVTQLRHLASCGVMLKDASSGRVSPSGDGRAHLSYDVNETDRRRLLEGLWEMGKVFFAAGAMEVHPGLAGEGTAKNLNELGRLLQGEVAVSQLGIYASHPMGTCRLSDRPDASVVKTTGESWEIDNFFIADASVFPTSLGVNPQITVMAVAHVLAQGVVARG